MIRATPASRSAGQAKNRMLFIIPEDSIRVWLNPEFTDVEGLRDLIVPFPPAGLQRRILP